MTSYPPHHGQINTAAFADGSSTTTSTSTMTPWSCETNWTVARGSLDSAVTFESFDFPIDSESTGPKPPLLLVPPSTSDFEPCEIKLNFSQKHEIRQVYVRSTARIYEIYYASHFKSENEYLCTVRCSAASVDENMFPETDVKNAISANLEGQNENLPKGRVTGENNIGTNEDDWVEIKLPVGQVNEGNTYLPNTLKNHQNYYEATAEINDSEPCTSLTLRLLSLQSKSFVHVDEVYVFADCTVTDDSNNQSINPEPSSGSSLMTMLVPTLLGLSKSRSLQLSKSVEKTLETESRPGTESTRCQVPPSTSDKDKVCDSTSRNGFSDNNRSELVLADSNGIGICDSESGVGPELTQCHGPPSNLVKDKDPNTPLLEQLVSRVSRIEEILLKFEEKILKPINNIETRLHHVEQQLELLTKNSHSHFPILPSSPENINQLCGDSESENKQDIEKPEINDVFENEKPKKPVSIDDAFAEALAGFSSFTKPDNSFPILPPESPRKQCLVDENNEGETGNETVTEMVDESNKTDVEIVEEDLIEAVNVLTFDKNDILKYFPDGYPEVENGSESGVDFETNILEVKFASLESGSFESNLEAFLCDERLVMEGESVEETCTGGSGLLVEVDGDDVVESVERDFTYGDVETSFDSLI
ncbi:hypothetical protein L1887_17978 [Cichorium endivia]|nr:hypothetical protein L1887_17978 [Cichorium endivia]